MKSSKIEFKPGAFKKITAEEELPKQTHKEDDSDDDEEIPPKMVKRPLSETFNNPSVLKRIVIALCVVVIVICAGFVVYQFYTKGAQKKVDICQQEKITAYEKQLEEISEQCTNLVNENQLISSKISALQAENSRLIEEKNRAETYEKKPQAVYRTSKKSKKQHVEADKDEFNEMNNEDDEYAVEHPTFDDAPITRGKKKINPQQALKTHINEGAKKAYDKKQSAIRSQMDEDREETEEREQMEIQQQLGLGRKINDEKLMELANEQEANQLESVEEIVEIDQSLIA